MDLKQVVKRLNEYADLGLAMKDWDNVGLLVEPSGNPKISRLLVTNDLTEQVLDEAIQQNINLIVSYHPVIFKPFLRRLTQSAWKERLIVRCIENKLAVYSPHTSWDTVDGGMNDWLIGAFNTQQVKPVNTQAALKYPTELSKSVKVDVLFGDEKEQLREALKSANNEYRLISEKKIHVGPMEKCELELVSSENGIVKLIDLIKETFDESTQVLSTLRIVTLEKPNLRNTGLGRFGALNEPITIREAVALIKKRTNLKHVRLALANGKNLDDKIKSIAVGAGSGSSILNNTQADLIVTGEFGHHEVLNENHRGVSVILTDHSNTERCYFGHFKEKFSELLSRNGESLEILISKVDRDPLEIV